MLICYRFRYDPRISCSDSVLLLIIIIIIIIIITVKHCVIFDVSDFHGS